MYLANFINGKLVVPQSQAYLPSYNPATGQLHAHVPASNHLDVQAAVDAAKQAFAAWAATPAEKKSKILARIADLIEANIETLSIAESTDNGKPVWLARKVDIARAATNFRFFASGLVHFASEAHVMEQTAINYTLRKPIGIVGCISPWNLPLYLFTWKIAPALAAGNCVVAKPSEVTPFTAFLLGEICNEAGLPPGVLNIVHGDGAQCGTAIVQHPDIKAISFTGSSRAGRDIASKAAPMLKKLSLELGGKNPNLIFADCNFEKTLQTTLKAAFRTQGQICLCGSRLYIERPIYEVFKKALIEQTAALTVGDPLDEGSQLGAIVSEVHLQKILSYIELAKQEGGKILAGGHQIFLEGRCASGWFVAPTIIEGLPNNCRTIQEEIFGPVITLTPFDSDEEALALANDSEYGLAATIFTENLNRAMYFADKIQTGIVWVNCWLLRDLRTPFGGVKNSGVGREGGWEAMRFFTEPKNVCIALS